VSDPAPQRPTICLNMIVRNEAHVVTEVLHAVAPYISTWVIVDTGSTDGTQDLIRTHLARLGIPGQLHQRPWYNFGHNRTEALALAQRHADYIWVMDADDTIVGAPDFTRLHADIYDLRYAIHSDAFWRAQLFRDGVRVRYEGVVHEYAICDDPCVRARLDGEYHIEARTIGARNLDPQKYAYDRDLLLAEVQRNPGDARAVFYLAQSYYLAGDFANARTWYARRAEMGGWDEEVYYSMYQVAVSMAELDEPWPAIQDTYLRAWEFRPTRAEPFYAIARRYREDARYQLGYMYAEFTAQISFPDEDTLFVRTDVYGWRALDEQAVCASWIGKKPEAFALCSELLTRPDIPDGERQRIAGNRDLCAPPIIDPASPIAPDAAPHMRFAVAIVSHPDYQHTEAFREVAETLHYALLSLGHDSVLTSRLDLDDRRTIVLGSNLLARYGLQPPQDSILYNLEQVDADSEWMTPEHLELFRRYRVWDYSQSNIERLAGWNVPRLTHVPIGYVPELTRIVPVTEDIDVLFYGSVDHRRSAVLDGLRARGLYVESLRGVYGASRDAWIARAKVVINMHWDDFTARVFQIVRVSYLLANKRAVVSERGANRDDERDLESGIAYADYDELVDRCVELVGDERARRELAERGYQAFSARSQAEILRRVLSSSLD
jgi:glycosyltransferase involved in cell wall biosynthesis